MTVVRFTNWWRVGCLALVVCFVMLFGVRHSGEYHVLVQQGNPNENIRAVNRINAEENLDKLLSLETLLNKVKRGYCVDSYKNITIPWNKEQSKKSQEFEAHLLHRVYGDKPKTFTPIEGNSGFFPGQTRVYYDIARLDFIKTVCETGFNAGHSAFMWLNSNPKIHLYSFDGNYHTYTKPMAEAIQSMFPGRFDAVYGDSRNTLPKFRQEHPNVKCDLVVVDGGHYQDVPINDMKNFRTMVNPRSPHLIIIDDHPGIKDVDVAWKHMVNNHLAKELTSCTRRIATHEGITLGMYIFNN